MSGRDLSLITHAKDGEFKPESTTKRLIDLAGKVRELIETAPDLDDMGRHECKMASRYLANVAAAMGRRGD